MTITVSHGITDHRPSSHVSNGKNTASQQESVFLDTGIAATYIFNAGRAALTRTSARSSMSGGFFEDASRAGRTYTVSDTGEETLLISYSGSLAARMKNDRSGRPGKQRASRGVG